MDMIFWLTVFSRSTPCFDILLYQSNGLQRHAMSSMVLIVRSHELTSALPRFARISQRFTCVDNQLYPR